MLVFLKNFIGFLKCLFKYDSFSPGVPLTGAVTAPLGSKHSARGVGASIALRPMSLLVSPTLKEDLGVHNKNEDVSKKAGPRLRILMARVVFV